MTAHKYKIRKRVPADLKDYLPVTEIKKVFTSSLELSDYHNHIKEAVEIAQSSGVPDKDKALLIPRILGFECVKESKQSSYLDYVYKYLAESEQYVYRQWEQRKYVLCDLVPELMPIDNLEEITPTLLYDFSKAIQQKGWKVSTANIYIRQVKTFLKWCNNLGVACPIYIPTLKPPHGSKARNDRKAFTADEVLLLLNSITNTKVRAFIKVLALTGMRPSEVSKAIVHNGMFDLTQAKQLKNNTSFRIIPIHPALTDDEIADAMTIKPNSRGFGNINYHIQQIIPNKSCYSLRHFFATTLINSDADPSVVSELMGHSHKTMTMSRYFKGYDKTTLYEAVCKLSMESSIVEKF
jgi:integrase